MSFKSIVTSVLSKDLNIQRPADDMADGEQFVIEGREGIDREKFQDDPGLRKEAVPQHFVPEYGHVSLLWKSPWIGEFRVQHLQKSEPVDDDITDREIVVAGYASPQVIDREKHLIEKEAMARDLPRFLANPIYANAMILHSNVQVGQVLAEWEHPETGQVYKTQVDDIGLFCVIRIRTDKYRPKICDKVVEDIEKGSLQAFSISGDAPVESRQHKCVDGECFWVIPEIEFYEITICEEGINQDAKLMVLNKSCSDGMCGLVRKDAEDKGGMALRTETEDELRERIEDVAARVGEEEAAQMLEDAADASRKLEMAKEDKGIGEGGDANMMGDFAQPYSQEMATQVDPEVDALVEQYAQALEVGGAPEQAYFQMLEGDVPPWFGTREDRFRQFLLAANRKGLAIPTVRLRMTGNKEGELIADPEYTAWDLLQSAKRKGYTRKDVSHVPHKHPEPKDGEYQTQTREEHPGLVDERGLRGEEENAGHREKEEPDESEKQYLNLAVDAFKKHQMRDDETHRHKRGVSGAAGVLTKATSVKHGESGQEHSHEAISGRTTTEWGSHPTVVGTYAHTHDPHRHGWKKQVGAKITPLKKAASGLHSHGPVTHAHKPRTHGVGDGKGGWVQSEAHGGAVKNRMESKHKGPNIKPHPHGQKNRPSARAGTGPQAWQGGSVKRPGGVPDIRPGDVVGVKGLAGISRYKVHSLPSSGKGVYIDNATLSFVPWDRIREHVPASKLDNFALPVEVGVREMKIVSGGREEPMDIVREQVARAKFTGAVISCWMGKAGRAARLAGVDFMQDPAQQFEPENVAVQAGVRKAPPGPGQPQRARPEMPKPQAAAPKAQAKMPGAAAAKPKVGPPAAQPAGGQKAQGAGNIGAPQNRRFHAAASTEIESNAQIAPSGGLKIATEPMEQTGGPAQGIADQGVVNPPVGIQGEGSRPEYIVTHGNDQNVNLTENEGTSMDARSDVDSRGAPVNR